MDKYQEMNDLLFGGGADELVHKLSPDDEKKRAHRRQAQVGLASNALGLAAGGAGTVAAFNELQSKRGKVKLLPKHKAPTKLGRLKTKHAVGLAGAGLGLQVANVAGDVVANRVLSREASQSKKLENTIKKSEPTSSDIHIPSVGTLKRKAAKKAYKHAEPHIKETAGNTKAKVLNGGAELEQYGTKVYTKGKAKFSKRGKGIYRSGRAIAQNSEVLTGKATRTVDEATKLLSDAGEGVRNFNNTSANIANITRKIDRVTNPVIAGGTLTAIGGAGATGYAAGRKRKPKKISKSVTWEGEISKVNEEKRQVFGWASIVEVDGEPVVDLQGDYIDIDEIEKSAYDYVVKSRKGGDMHRRNGDEPFHAADMIESFIVTPEKKEKMGLPDDVPTGWWVGYKINDDEAWELVKTGKRTGFSIHGRGQRTPVVL